MSSKVRDYIADAVEVVLADLRKDRGFGLDYPPPPPELEDIIDDLARAAEKWLKGPPEKIYGGTKVKPPKTIKYRGAKYVKVGASKEVTEAYTNHINLEKYIEPLYKLLKTFDEDPSLLQSPPSELLELLERYSELADELQKVASALLQKGKPVAYGNPLKSYLKER